MQGGEFKRLIRFILRALRLRCPECGVSPIFPPTRETRSLFDWFTPLDGCPRCGYAYRREPGYFMMSICALNYGVVAGLAIVASFIVESIYAPPMWVHVSYMVPFMLIGGLGFVRHAKALFIAIDHYFDPHDRRTPAIH